MRPLLSIIALATCLFGITANAEQCTKDFPNHFITSEGRLGFYQGVGGAWWYPCSVSSTINGVTPESCKSALATYLTAKALGKSITLSYPGTCAALSSDTSTDAGFTWFGIYWH
jgi:hypothetical protein